MPIDNPGQITKVCGSIAVHWFRHRWYLAFNLAVGPTGHGHHRCARVHSDQALLVLTIWSTETERLSIHLDVIKLDSEHIFEEDRMPNKITFELGLIIVSERQVRFRLLSSDCQIECKEVILEQVLLHHVVEYRGDAPLCKCRICHANDRFEASIENTSLLLDLAELLVLDADGAVTLSDSQIVHEEVS